MLWPKKNSLRNLITKKNSCASKIPHPSPPPSITFLMVCQMRHNNEWYLETWHFNYNNIKRANQLPTCVSSTCYSLMPIIQFPTTWRGSLCPFANLYWAQKLNPVTSSIAYLGCPVQGNLVHKRLTFLEKEPVKSGSKSSGEKKKI